LKLEEFLTVKMHSDGGKKLNKRYCYQSCSFRILWILCFTELY